LTCPLSIPNIIPVMNIQYNHIYVNDKAEPNVSKIPEQDLFSYTVFILDDKNCSGARLEFSVDVSKENI
jgi:hypothetical protein